MKTKQPIIVATVNGYEPAYWNEEFQEYCIEPGYASPTMAEAVQRLQDDLEVQRQNEAASLDYNRGMAFACGYRD
jgi:hypothetical protein